MQSEVEAIGREIFARIAGAKPKLFSHSNLTGTTFGMVDAEGGSEDAALPVGRCASGARFEQGGCSPRCRISRRQFRRIAAGHEKGAGIGPPGSFSHRTANATCCQKDCAIFHSCAGPDGGSSASACHARPLDCVYRGSAGRNGVERTRSGGIHGPLPRFD